MKLFRFLDPELYKKKHFLAKDKAFNDNTKGIKILFYPLQEIGTCGGSNATIALINSLKSNDNNTSIHTFLNEEKLRNNLSEYHLKKIMEYNNANIYDLWSFPSR